MLREASISEITSKKIPKEKRVLVNRGRGNDELGPSDELFADFNARKADLEAELGKGSAEAHNRAFVDSDYARRFRAQIESDTAALAKLEEIAKRSETGDVYLVCYEGVGKACHRRVLLRIAAERFEADVEIDGIEPNRVPCLKRLPK